MRRRLVQEPQCSWLPSRQRNTGSATRGERRRVETRCRWEMPSTLKSLQRLMFRCSLKSEDKLCAEELGQQCLGSSPAIQESYPRREAPCSHYTMHTIRGSTYADPRCWVARLLLRCTLLFVRLLGLIPCEPVSQYRSDGLSKLALGKTD